MPGIKAETVRASMSLCEMLCKQTRRTLAIDDRQMGQPLSMAATVSAHVMQKREYPQGTRATPSRGAMRQTSHVADNLINSHIAFCNIML